MTEHWITKLESMNACEDAVEWARDYPSEHIWWLRK